MTPCHFISHYTTLFCAIPCMISMYNPPNICLNIICFLIIILFVALFFISYSPFFVSTATLNSFLSFLLSILYLLLSLFTPSAVSYFFHCIIQALTEGFGPLIFGLLMGLFERTPVPGAPYLLACVLSLWAFLHCFELPPEPEQVTPLHTSSSPIHSCPSLSFLCSFTFLFFSPLHPPSLKSHP